MAKALGEQQASGERLACVEWATQGVGQRWGAWAAFDTVDPGLRQRRQLLHGVLPRVGRLLEDTPFEYVGGGVFGQRFTKGDYHRAVQRRIA